MNQGCRVLISGCISIFLHPAQLLLVVSLLCCATVHKEYLDKSSRCTQTILQSCQSGMVGINHASHLLLIIHYDIRQEQCAQD